MTPIVVMPRFFLPIYTHLCAAYGLMRALPGPVYAEKEQKTLAVDWAARCCMSAVMAPLLWPMYLYMDARALEVRARGLRPDDYSLFDFP